MTAVTQIRAEIESHPAGSATARLLSWAELQIGDQFDVIDELTQELQEANSREEQLRSKLADALHTIALKIAADPAAFYHKLERDDWFRLARACSMRPPKTAELGRIKERIESLEIDARAHGIVAYFGGEK